ncbi:MAG: hypothetical protein FWG12_05950, partial [Holophagaceae bacterium]|nr:hypothetical protein [Holophagaceae bacterium]
MAVQPILDGHWLDKGMTGPSPESNFYNQELGTLKAFEYAINGIDSSGNPTHGPLLLVTTYPSGYDVNKQGALWGYKICSGSPELIFAVSLGAGVSSNSPNIDCRNGVIAVGRLVSSVALIDINAAISGWAQWANDPGLATNPGGVNQQAIFQAFHMADPQGPEIPANYGVSLLPTERMTNGTQEGIAFAVAVSQLTQAVRGVPNMILESPTYAWEPQPPFRGQSGQKDDRAIHIPIGDNLGFRKQALIENITIQKESQTVTTNVLVALEARDQKRLYFIDEGNPKQPETLGYWQAPGTILYREPSIDRTTNLMAVPVAITEGADSNTVWFVLSVSDPASPSVVAEIRGLGDRGAMCYGVLYTSSGSRLAAVDLNLAVQPQQQAQQQTTNTGRLDTSPTLSPIVKTSVPNSLFDCDPALGSKVSINLVTINQAVERHLDNDNKNIGTDLRGLNKYRNNQGQLLADFEWKETVPLVGGRPAVFRVYAKKLTGKDIPPVNIKLELTGPTNENLRTEVFEANEGTKSITYKNEEFGNVDHENVFTFEVTDKEAFSLLGPNTKVKVIVEPEGPMGSQINLTSQDVYNPYKDGKEIEFEYSEP